MLNFSILTLSLIKRKQLSHTFTLFFSSNNDINKTNVFIQQKFKNMKDLLHLHELFPQ